MSVLSPFGDSKQLTFKKKILTQSGTGLGLLVCSAIVVHHFFQKLDILIIQGDVYFYYALENYFQNNRRYMKSRSDKQLLGDLLANVCYFPSWNFYPNLRLRLCTFNIVGQIRLCSVHQCNGRRRKNKADSSLRCHC